MTELNAFTPASMRGSKRLIAAASFVALATVGIVFFVRHSDAKSKTAQPAAALTVTVASATEANWPTTLQADGAIAPWQEAVIGAQVAGLRMAEVRVNVGDRVKRGQILAVFDAGLLRADEARLKASWEQAEANRQRAQQLKGSGGISEQEVLKYVTDADVAKAQLQYTQLQLSYADVRAPDDGVISARSATLGAVSGSGQELFRMIRQSRLEWRGELTGEQLAHVKLGQRVLLSLPDRSTATAQVRQMAPNLDTQTRLGILYADIKPGSMARAGMYVTGKVVLSDSPAITVPAVSVVIRDGRSYVPKVVEGNRVSLKAVTVGRRQGDAAEIVSGISVGDKVAVQGAGFLNDGDLVRVVAP